MSKPPIDPYKRVPGLEVYIVDHGNCCLVTAEVFGKEILRITAPSKKDIVTLFEELATTTRCTQQKKRTMDEFRCDPMPRDGDITHSREVTKPSFSFGTAGIPGVVPFGQPIPAVVTCVDPKK